MNIEELDLEVKAFNRLKKAGINTVDELLAEMYSPGSKVSQPDAKRCEEALKTAGIIRFMRGDYVDENDIEPEPLTWDELHNYIGKLVVFDCSTESHKWLKVNWIYDMQDEGEDGGTVICSDGSKSYSYIRRRTVEGGYTNFRDPEYLERHAQLKYSGRFFTLRKETTSMIQPQMKTPPADVTAAVTDKYTEAYNLNVRICVNAQMAQQNLYEVCKGLKEMRDGKLYKELGYKNFEDYCESEVGIKRRQAYGYISVASSLSKDFVHSSAQIGIKKLELLAKLDEPQREEIQQTVNVEEVSVKELKAEIDKLKDAQKGYKERQDKLLQKNKDLVKELEDSEACRDKLSADLDESRDTVSSLEKQIEELENKPVDVYENTAKINELKAKISEMEVENAAKIARIQSECQSKTAGEPEVCKAVFQAYLTSAADALRRLCDFAEEHKPAEEFNYYIARINKLISHAESEASRIGGK